MLFRAVVVRRSADDPHAVRLRSLRALHHVELHPLVLVEGLVAFGLDGRVVDEDVLTAVHGDEAVALFVVEPLHGALCHVHSSLGGWSGPPPLVGPGVFPPEAPAEQCTIPVSGSWFLACENVCHSTA